MSEKQEEGGNSEPTLTTGAVTNTILTNAGEESSSHNNNVISPATKEISDVIHFQGSSTSKNYHFKTEISINITGEDSHVVLEGNDSPHLCLFETNVESLKLKEGAVAGEESYTIVDACVMEKMTENAEVVTFSRNDRTQTIIAVNSEAPPPYDSQAPSAYSQGGYYSNINAASQTASSVHNRNGRGFSENDYSSYFGEFIFPRTRQMFVKKVFTILSVQLTITTVFILLAMYHQKTKQFMLKNNNVFCVMLMTEMILLTTLMCYGCARRAFPLNFILLFIFTVSMSYICAFITLIYATWIVVLSAGSAAIICLLATLSACQPWFDLTKWSFIIKSASGLLMLFTIIVGLVTLFTTIPILWLIYAAVVIISFTVFLFYDMQCILGGRRHEISPEEYIYAALMIYVDVIVIFLCWLHIFRRCAR